MNVLFSLCWLDEDGRLERNQKWLDYNLKIKSELGFDKIILLDNASDLTSLKTLNGTIYDEDGTVIHNVPNSDVIIYRFQKHLARTGIWQYPYCYRGVEYLQKLIPALGIDKVLFIDSDFYVLTSKLADYIKNLSTGWVSFWCHKYGWPEAALHILCKDSFPAFLSFPIPSYTHYNDRNMEELLPFTYVWKDTFKGDRYGEGREIQTVDIDYYGQWSPGCPDMEFNKK